MFLRYERTRRAIKKDPHAREYLDAALEPVVDDEFELHEMFKVSAAAGAAVEKHRKEERARAKVAAAS